MLLDNLSCLAVLLRVIHENLQRIYPYSVVIHGSTTFKLTKGLQTLKKNDQLLNLVFLFFHFLRPNFPDNKCQTEVARAFFYMYETSGLSVTPE